MEEERRSRRHESHAPARERDRLRRESLIRTLYLEETRALPEWLGAGLLRTGEVALILRVTPRSVVDWARSGKLPYVTTPGGQRRYRARDVRVLLDLTRTEHTTIDLTGAGERTPERSER